MILDRIYGLIVVAAAPAQPRSARADRVRGGRGGTGRRAIGLPIVVPVVELLQ